MQAHSEVFSLAPSFQRMNEASSCLMQKQFFDAAE